MRSLDPIKLAEWASGMWRNGKPREILGLSNDTRSLSPGQMFIALRTEKRDGHDFLADAEKAGASCAIVDTFRSDSRLCQLVVPDTGAALVGMGTGFRRTWNLPVIGVTGSCGKTTCKELLRLALGYDEVVATEGNLNNLIGVPISLLKPTADEARCGVFEAGISEPGEMERLARMIDPDWVVFTAIGPAHLKDLGTEENVAREKGLLARGERAKRIFVGETCAPYVDTLGVPRAAFVKSDPKLADDWSYWWKETAEGHTIVWQRVFGRNEEYELQGTGGGLASNVALANAVARSMGVSSAIVAKGFSKWKSANLRGEWRTVGGVRYYLDCYNANPLSMEAAIETFVKSARPRLPRFFVVGCMEELGEGTEAYHEKLGASIPLRAEDFLLVVGGFGESVLRGMKSTGKVVQGSWAVERVEDGIPKLLGFNGDVFVKGSRRFRLENIVRGSEVQSC